MAWFQAVRCLWVGCVCTHMRMFKGCMRVLRATCSPWRSMAYQKSEAAFAETGAHK